MYICWYINGLLYIFLNKKYKHSVTLIFSVSYKISRQKKDISETFMNIHVTGVFFRHAWAKIFKIGVHVHNHWLPPLISTPFEINAMSIVKKFSFYSWTQLNFIL